MTGVLLGGVLLLSVQVPSEAPQPVPTGYVIGAEDVLRVTVFGEPDLTRTFPVDVDGTFEYPLLGRIQAGGLTVSDIQRSLTERLADGYLRHPQVTVEVDQFRSQSVFIIGEVRSPGRYVMRGSMLLLEALAEAGSTTSNAASEVLIIHPLPDETADAPALPDQDEEREITRINLAALQTGRLSGNVELRDGDTIFVPRAENFFVSGFVRTPGSYILEPGMTVLQALTLAGGLSERGSSRRIKIMRVIDGERTEIDVDMDDIVQPGDTIVVPQRFF